MKFHPYAEVFPLIEGPQFDELISDIKSYGLREKIWVFEGKILDGRNRFLACQKAKVKPEYRQYRGKDALAFVISLNVQRRHLSDAQRAMAAARIATLKLGANQHEGASREAPSQSEAAEQMDVSRTSVQRARKILEKGSKALQQAVDSGVVPLKKAVAVIDLPKSEQLSAAKEPTKLQCVDTHVKIISQDSETEINDPERPDDMEDMDRQAAESYERERQASIDKWLEADDKLAAAQKEIERQAAEIIALKTSRNGEMNTASEAIKLVKQRDRTILKLGKDLEKANNELDKLRERVAIMEAA